MKLPTNAIQKCSVSPRECGCLPVARGNRAYTPPQIANVTKPYMVKCECPTVKLVKCHTCCNDRKASKVP